MPDRTNHDEDGEIPTFHCRLQIPDGLAPGVRTLIEQQDISRQLTEHLYRKSSKAITLAIDSDARTARVEALAEERWKQHGERLIALEQFKWKATWIVGALLVVIELAAKHFIH